MRVKKISAFVLSLILCLSPFTLFSFAADTQSIKDSGSPEVSLMALRSIAADDGISLAAAEGNSGQFGYNIEPFDLPSFRQGSYSTGRQLLTSSFTLEPGTYYLSFDFNRSFYSGSFFPPSGDLSLAIYGVISGNSCVFSFTLTEPLVGYFVFNYPLDGDELSILDYSSSLLFPVEGISSGYTYTRSVSDSVVHSFTDTFSWDFGNQPAGNYLINIYHYGISYDCSFDIAYGSSITGSNSRFLPTSRNGSVTTCIVSHSGGDFILSGTLNAWSVDLMFGIEGATSGGTAILYSRDAWSFAVTDVIAVPLESAGLEQFGIFGAVIGFFRDQFSDLKSWIAIQIDKIAGDDETQSDVDDAQSELQKEVDDLNNLSGQLDTQASNLEQQFTTDFAIPDSVSGQGTNFQSIYTSLFGSLGVFGIFIWLPIVMAVIKKLLRL